jgi:hypothetical protein
MIELFSAKNKKYFIIVLIKIDLKISDAIHRQLPFQKLKKIH